MNTPRLDSPAAAPASPEARECWITKTPGVCEGDTSGDGPLKPIWLRIAEMGEILSAEEQSHLPVDLAEQHDHYLYGTPKR